jgi:cell division topological specificity factor
MALLDFFLSRKKNTANIAKERLQIIVAERRRSDAEPHYLPQLRKDILEVICKYVQIDPEMVTVQLEQKDGDISILELNVTLPETEESKSGTRSPGKRSAAGEFAGRHLVCPAYINADTRPAAFSGDRPSILPASQTPSQVSRFAVSAPSASSATD